MKKILIYSGLIGAVWFASFFMLAGCDDSSSTSSIDTLYVIDTTPPTDQGYGSLKYVGSAECESCHQENYDMFRESGHPYKLNKVENGVKPVYPSFVPAIKKPDGTQWSDFAYVIGGYGWKARYVKNDGYIYTPAEGKNQYNLDGTWSNYHPGEEVKYNCGSCHTTGYDPDGESQDGLEGVVGSWVEPGVQCEECHGAGSYHVDSKGLVPLKVDRSKEACGACHVRGGDDDIPAKNGFIEHHEQFNEMVHSKKAALNCVDCHNPHASTKYDSAALGKGVKVSCEGCHSEEAISYKEGSPRMVRAGIGCVDCHMPKATKSAVAEGEHAGDVRTHIFTINTDLKASQFNADSSQSEPYITLSFACMSCHADSISEDMPAQDLQWAAAFANGVHNPSPKFIGSEACAKCHESEYEMHQEHGHRRHLYEVGGVEPVFPSYLPEIKLPAGVEWSDVGFMVGGFAWKARFLDSNGYFITTGGKNEYLLAADSFADYHKDEAEYGYHCAECHTTGYDPDGHNDLPGFEGTWSEVGVMCEKCHGPGGDHAGSDGFVRLRVDRDKEMCNECHAGGDGKALYVSNTVSGPFIGRHHYLGNEMNNSKHAAIECSDCHNPHASTHYDADAAGTGIKQVCQDCHARQAATFAEGSPLMSAAGVTCTDCHMPKASIMASPVNQWVGDRTTHLFKINMDPNAPQFDLDSTGKAISTKPYIGLGFACLSCHGDESRTDISEDKRGKDVAWAGMFARSVHRQDNDVPVSYVGYEVCKTCHETVFEEWVATDHGHDFRNDTTNNHPGTEGGRDFIRGLGGACAPCHVVGYTDPTGWNDIANRVGATTEDSVRLEGIQCESCHGPSSQHAQDGQVKYGMTDVDYEASCIRCHVGSWEQLSGHVGPADSAAVEGHLSGLHHPQALLYFGADLYEYPGKTYKHSVHKTEVVQGCRTCHMFPGTTPLHDLMPDAEACMDCHADFAVTASASKSSLVKGHTLEFSYQGKQDSIDILYLNLETLLTEALALAADSTDSATVKGSFPYKAAYYNLKSIAADKSFGIHDYKYISQILKDAIADSARYLHILP